jgi:hypothetical protein
MLLLYAYEYSVVLETTFVYTALACRALNYL